MPVFSPTGQEGSVSSVRLRRVAGIVSTALLALLIASPAAVNAAVPLLTPTWSVIPTTVQDGDYVAFRASITNDDNSTVSQLFLVEVARDPNLTLVPGSVSSSQGSCDSTTDPAAFLCTLGQLKPHRTATVTAVFWTALVVDPATFYTATERWEFNTTGLGSDSGGDNSHGDSWPSVDENGADLLVATVTSSGDFGGRYVLNGDLKIVENNQALSNSNPHSTRAFAPITGIGVTVEDIDCDVELPETPDPICAGFTTGFGEVSKVNVNDGIDVSGTEGTTLLHFYLQLDSSEVPPGANANTVSVFHVWGPAPTDQETISTRCTFAKKATLPNNAACISVKNLPGGDLGVDVWTFHNGGLRLQ
jgi:hypothetical protein